MSLLANQRASEARRDAQQYARSTDHLPWLATFGALENEEVRRDVIAGLAGAIVGYPAVEDE